MNNEYRKRCREFIAKDGWKRYGIIDEPPSILDVGKEFEIMYEDMDGNPCLCSAVWEKTNVMGQRRFKAIDGMAKGNWMSAVFAYRALEDKGIADMPLAEAVQGWIPFRDDLLIRENAAEAVGEFFNKMDISLFGRTGVRLARNVLNSVPTVAPLKWIPLNKDGHEPLFEGDYLLCLDDGYIANVFFDGSDWELWADSGEPVAWMPLPKPYREDGEDV